MSPQKSTKAMPSAEVPQQQHHEKRRMLPTDRFPQTQEEADLAEALLAKEMEKLSVQERESILYDIHGVSEKTEVHPSIVEQKLTELEQELEAILQVQWNTAYTQALQQNSAYVTSKCFRLLFLRTEKFDVKRAAELIIRHFEVKRKLFGDGDILGRPVLQSDLMDKAKAVLESGLLRVWPTRDSAGRVIFLLQSPTVVDVREDVTDDYRVTWYLMMKCLEDEETQKHGAVWIISLANCEALELSVDQAKGMRETQAAIPLATNSEHFCSTNPKNRPYLSGIQMFAHDTLRPRIKVHYGTYEEIVFKLQTFGIPTTHLPGTADKDAQLLEEHQKWVASLRAKETVVVPKARLPTSSDPESDDDVIVPRRFDVLFGRSVLAREHTGNLRALHIVEMNFAAYEKMGRYQKTDLAEKIVREIHQCGGRFLRQEQEGEWVVVHDDEARKKVAHWFRRRREEKLLVQKEQTSTDPSSSPGDSTST